MICISTIYNHFIMMTAKSSKYSTTWMSVDLPIDGANILAVDNLLQGGAVYFQCTEFFHWR